MSAGQKFARGPAAPSTQTPIEWPPDLRWPWSLRRLGSLCLVGSLWAADSLCRDGPLRPCESFSPAFSICPPLVIGPSLIVGWFYYMCPGNLDAAYGEVSAVRLYAVLQVANS